MTEPIVYTVESIYEITEDYEDRNFVDLEDYNKLKTVIQQLKAEILPLLTDALDEFADRKFNRGEYYLKQAMAKLSAI